jgi:hypothetical protein
MVESKGDPMNGLLTQGICNPASSDKGGIEACASAAGLHYLTGEPLDERDLRSIRILYHRKGCTACIRSSRGSMPDSDMLAERRSRETTSVEG